MKQIIKQYGGFFISAVCILLFFSFFLINIRDANGNKGILKIIGSKITITDKKYKEYIDFDSYTEESEKSLPTITYCYRQNVISGRDILLTDLISAKNENDTVLPLKVISVKDSKETNITDIYNAASGSISFPNAGIYKIALTVTDEAMKNYTCTIKVPVIKGN